MRIPSRAVAPLVQESPTSKAVTQAVLVLVTIALALFAWPIAFALVAIYLWAKQPKVQSDQVAAERTQVSICTFARSFNLRAVDPWIVRAVYEELTYLCRFPVKPDDHLVRDLCIDEEDFEYAVVDIADRARRSLQPITSNPPPDINAPIRDLVAFLNHQPALPKT